MHAQFHLKIGLKPCVRFVPTRVKNISYSQITGKHRALIEGFVTYKLCKAVTKVNTLITPPPSFLICLSKSNFTFYKLPFLVWLQQNKINAKNLITNLDI